MSHKGETIFRRGPEIVRRAEVDQDGELEKVEGTKHFDICACNISNFDYVSTKNFALAVSRMLK